MEEEIDLREYIEVLLKYWKWIVGVALLAAVAAFVVTSMQPRVYEAQSDVLILKSKTEILLEPKYQTEIAGLSNQKGYQQTLVSLATSSNMAASVLDQAKDLLPPESQNILDILKKVEASSAGDIISIKATDQNPQTAAELANLWARAYAHYINTLFGSENEALLTEIQKQAQDVGQVYEISQADWEQFKGDNQITLLEREIVAKKEQAQTLRDAGLDVEQLPLTLFSLEQEAARKILTDEYQRLNQIDKWLEDAGTMRDQLVEPTSSSSAKAGNALALMGLQSNILAESSNYNYPVRLQFLFTDIADQSVSVKDVDSLIEVFEARKERIEKSIAERSVALVQSEANITPNPNSENLAQIIAGLDTEILFLEEQLEAQRAKQRELKQTRDLAWENFPTTQRKLAETELTSQVTDTQVRVAANAIVPKNPVSSGRLMNTAIAGILGAMLTVFVVFAKEYWQQNDD